MTVNYQTGVATSPTDLLTKFLTFIGAHGWDHGTPSSGDAVIWNGSASTIFAGIDATATQWQTRGCLSFSSGAAWNAQPNNSGLTHSVTFGAGPFTAYHFYVGDEAGAHYAHCTVEFSSGNFQHWVLGQVVKSGSMTGGVYADSSDYNSAPGHINQPDDTSHRFVCDTSNSQSETGHIHVDYDSKVNNWQKLRAVSAIDANACIGSYRGSGLQLIPIAIGSAKWNLRTVLMPALYFANRASSLRSPLGRIPNFRFVNMANFSPGEVVTYGSENWQVFPVFSRQSAVVGATTLSSGLYGYAHRRP